MSNKLVPPPQRPPPDGLVSAEVQHLLDAMPGHALLIDEHHRIVAANRGCASALGITTPPPGACCHDKAAHGLDPFAGCPLQAALVSGKHEQQELRDSQGRWTLLEVVPTALKTADGARLFLHLMSDVTERKEEHERAIRNSDVQTANHRILNMASGDAPLEDILQHALDLLLSFTWLAFDRSGAIFVTESPGLLVMKASRGLHDRLTTRCARVAFGTCHCGTAAMLGVPVHAHEIDERHVVRYEGMVDHGHYCVPIVAGGAVLGVVNVYLKPGHPCSEAELELLNAIAGTLGGVIRHRREEQERRRLATILEATSDFVGIADATGKTLYINRAARQMMGLALDEDVSSRPVVDYHPPRARVVLEREAIPAAIKDGLWSGENTVLRSDGTELPVSQMILAHRKPDGQLDYLSTIIRDISDQKRARLALEASERKYRALFEESSDAIFISSAGGRVLDINPAGVALFGYESKQDMLDRVDISRDLYMQPEGRSEFVRAVSEQGQVRRLAIRLKKRNGEPIEALISASAMTDDSGVILGYRGVIADLTEQKRLEHEFLQAQKMEAVGVLANGVAHDFNNIISVVSANAGFLVDSLPPASQNREDAVEILKAARRAGALTRQLLAFSRRAPANPVELAVNDTIGDLARMLGRLLGDHVRLELELSPEPCCIRMDPSQLEQVLMNLAVNARDAMGSRGTLVLATQRVEIRAGRVCTHGRLEPGEWVVIRVSDAGSGMDDATIRRIFEPFFTTKPSGKGTGLGLAMVRRAVDHAQGCIEVTSELDAGTTFSLFFRSTQTGASLVPGPRTAPPRGRGQSILVVEDDDSVRKSIARVLANAGYRVVEAATGHEALSWFVGHPDDIDLVLADFFLPDMEAPQLFAGLREVRSSVRVLCISGHVNADSLEPESFLQKPVEPEDVLRAIGRLMES